MEQFSDFPDLSEILANAAGSQVMWGKFLECLTKQTACESAYLLITDLVHREKTRFLFSFNVPEQQLNRYVAELNKVDIFNYLLAKNPCQAFCSQKSEVTVKGGFNDGSGFQYRFGFAIPCNTHHSLTLGVNRKHFFSLQEQHHISELLQGIISPLEGAMRAELQQKIYSQILQHTHDHVDGYVIVDHSLNILFADSNYASVIDKFHCINISDNQIIFKNPDIYQRLLFLIGNNEAASIHNQCETCLITLIPVASLDNLYDWECFKEGSILTFTHDKKNNPILERLINVHDLSRCEALCALDFMLTPSIVDIAESKCRSENTVRNHLKRIMQKMEVHNQAALMKKLVALAAL